MSGKEFKQSRRNALKIISSVIVGVAAYLLGRFLHRVRPEHRILEIALDKIPQGFSAFPEVFIQRRNAQIVVFSRACPHLGCQLPPADRAGMVRCPCHGSTFKTSGQFVAGPAAKPLTRLPFSLKNDRLYVRLKGNRS
jgi:Rieske Fe-S protein